MISKKNTSTNDEFSIDLLELLKKWWYFRKLIFFGTGIVVLLSLFIIIILDQTIKSKNYTSSTLRGDLGDNNSLIIDTFYSVDIADKALKTLSLEISANKFLDHLIIKEGTDPLTMSLKDRVNSINNQDIKALILSYDDLNSIVANLDEASSDKITIEFYHSSLNLSDKQAINIIDKLVNEVNKNLREYTAKADNKLSIIDTKLVNLGRDKSELIVIFINILKSIEKNIAEMKKYDHLLVDIDLEKMSTLLEISKKILQETSKLVGSTYSSEILNLELKTIDRNIENLKNSLLDLERSTAFSADNYKNNDSEKESIDNIALDKDVFNTILSIGGALQLNEFRLETLTKIQNFQLEKSLLLSEKEFLELPYRYTRKDLSLEIITGRVLELTKDVNRAVTQVYKFSRPKKAVHFLRNPEIVNEDKELISFKIRFATILSVIGFFLISFIAILLPRKS